MNESYVLPIVSQLGGEPQVTDEGDIIYVFLDCNSLQRALQLGPTHPTAQTMLANELRRTRHHTTATTSTFNDTNNTTTIDTRIEDEEETTTAATTNIRVDQDTTTVLG